MTNQSKAPHASEPQGAQHDGAVPSRTAGEPEGAQGPRSESMAESLLRIGAAIAAAHAGTFSAMMLDIIQRDADADPQPRRDAVTAALQPGDPMGAGAHILDAVRTTLSRHRGVADELSAMTADTSPLAMLAAINGQDGDTMAASSYALEALRQTTDATVAAICSLPGVDQIARTAVTQIPSPDDDAPAIAAARRAGLPLTFLAALLDENGSVPMELAIAARNRVA